MNPEFQRQLWLHFSPLRLAVLPLLQLLYFAAVTLSAKENPMGAITIAGVVLFTLLVLLMGTFAAGAAVLDEVTDGTWDQQRLSAMPPWAMTWGKLAGATLYAWYGGALCLLVTVPAALQIETPQAVARWVLGGILGGLFLQALLLAVNLQLVRSNSLAVRRGGIWTLVLVLLWGLFPLAQFGQHDAIAWWGQSYHGPDFLLATLAALLVCALFGAWRAMAEVLAVRHWPWGWPAFALLVTVYLSGFVSAPPGPMLWSVGLVVCLGATYLALLAEPQPRPLWQGVVRRWHAGQWSAAILQLPRWPTTLLLALPCALMVAASPHEAQWWADLWHRDATLEPLVLVLLTARDCALALFFAFAPGARRPMLAWGVLLLVLYALLPWLLAGIWRELMGLAWPLLAATPAAAVVLALVHLLLALALLHRRAGKILE